MPPSSAIQVFMSYSRRDNAVMQRIVSFLRNQGMKVWVDNEKLVPGTPIWEEEIEKAIKAAPAVVVVLSPDSKSSEWVRREISLADQYRKRVFPVLVRGDEESSITLRLANRQYVDIRSDEERGLNSLSTALLHYLEEIHEREQNAKEEAERLAVQKADEKRIAAEKAEAERRAKEEAEHLAAQKRKKERETKEKLEVDNRLRVAREKEELKRRNAEIYNHTHKATTQTAQTFLPKLKIPASILAVGIVGYFLWQGFSPLNPAPTITTIPAIEPTNTIEPISLAFVNSGHADAGAEAFIHWNDADPKEVPTSCAKCHTTKGFKDYLVDETVDSAVPTPPGALTCDTCHISDTSSDLVNISSVTFPSGYVIENADKSMMICIGCHQGRSSTTTINQYISRFGSALDPDTVRPYYIYTDGNVIYMGFQNIHYFAAGATLFGNEVQGAYQYTGKEYAGQNVSHPFNKCQDCHDVHSLNRKTELCATCHGNVEPKNIRFDKDNIDYDGDGNITEGIKGEIDSLAYDLYAKIQRYSLESGDLVTYEGSTYPYFFGEDGNNYAAWTPRLLKAAFNYQYVQKDPGTFVHNPKYVIQFLIDSIEDLGGDVSKFTRP